MIPARDAETEAIDLGEAGEGRWLLAKARYSGVALQLFVYNPLGRPGSRSDTARLAGGSDASIVTKLGVVWPDFSSLQLISGISSDSEFE